MTKPTLTAALALAGLMFLGSTAVAQAVVPAPPPLRYNTPPAARPPSSCPTCRRRRSWEGSEAGRC